jgi:hypothetical protein
MAADGKSPVLRREFSCRMRSMQNESLLQANPYLRDPEARKLLLAKTACTSSSIEGVTFSVEETLAALPKSPRTPTHRRPSGASAAPRG